MRMINCSRLGVEPLKFWRLLNTVGMEGEQLLCPLAGKPNL